MEETIQDLLVKLDSLVEARRYRDALSLGQRMLSKFKGNRALILKLASLYVVKTFWTVSPLS